MYSQETIYDLTKNASNNLKYPFFDGYLDVNIIGIRNSSKAVDTFNDMLGVCWKQPNGKKRAIYFEGTTKPGLYWLNKKLGNVNGTFILKPGFYKSCWTKGNHKTYSALIQSQKARFVGWRDNDNDGSFDFSGKLYYDVTGLNFHTTSFRRDVENVGPYSAGCQVADESSDFEKFRQIVYKSMNLYGPYVSYKLFNDWQFFM